MDAHEVLMFFLYTLCLFPESFSAFASIDCFSSHFRINLKTITILLLCRAVLLLSTIKCEKIAGCKSHLVYSLLGPQEGKHTNWPGFNPLVARNFATIQQLQNQCNGQALWSTHNVSGLSAIAPDFLLHRLTYKKVNRKKENTEVTQQNTNGP